MAVADILSNPKYPDDMVLTVADGVTFKVGEIRALPAAERAAVTAQITERQNTLEPGRACLRLQVSGSCARWLDGSEREDHCAGSD